MNISRLFPLLALLVSPVFGWVQSSWVDDYGLWPDGSTITMTLRFSAVPNPPGTTWNALAISAMNEWNSYIADVQFAANADSGTSSGANNGINEIIFADTIYGKTVLTGLCLYWSDGSRITESDIAINKQDALDGVIDAYDFRETVLWGLGHVLGLGAPDVAGQQVDAVMNMMSGNWPDLRIDDIEGIQALYGVRPWAPYIVTEPTRSEMYNGTLYDDPTRTVSVGATVQIMVRAHGSELPTYQWQHNGVDIAGGGPPAWFGLGFFYGTFDPTNILTLSNVRSADAGQYRVVVSNSSGSVTSAVVTLIVQGGITITTAPVAQTVNAGANVTFTIAATSDGAAPTYQWSKDSTAITGATSTTLSLTNVQPSDAGQFSVTVTNGVDTVTTTPVALTVNYAPTITSQPTEQTVVYGGKASFSVAATGTPAPTFQWKKDGSAISGATSSTYEIPSATTGDVGSYTCVVTNSVGSVTSSAASLTVQTFAPSIITQPQPQTVGIGDTATFTCAVSAAPSAGYQWQKDGVNIPGATSGTLTIANVQNSSVGQYRMVATNSLGSATSNTAALTIATVAPTIATQPVAQTVNVGKSVTFTALARGAPSPTYQWQKDGVAIAGATGSSYTIASVKIADAGQYRAVATNSEGNATSEAATLTVNFAPTVTTAPVSQTATAGDNVTFTVKATGVPAPYYKWQYEFMDITGATSATLSLANVTTSSAGRYRVVVYNSVGSVTTESATLTVNPKPGLPTIITQPTSRTVATGTDSMLSVVAAAVNSTLTYQWKKDDVNIAGATDSNFWLRSVQLAHAGKYTCVVTSTVGSITSDAAVVTVTAAPVITTQPTSQKVGVGAKVVFSIAATGTPTPTYQWKKDGVFLTGATAASYEIAMTTTNSVGTYTCTVSNTAGTVTSNAATLTISEMPVITTQPVDRTVLRGESVEFTVGATGTPTPTFQWLLNGQVVDGATAATFPAFNADGYHNGWTFACVVTNASGSVTSNIATLTVQVPTAPAIVTQPADVIGEIGTPASFTVEATGVPTPTYQWLLNGSPVSGATAATFPAFNIAGYHNGWAFSCVVTNASGSVTTRAATLHVGAPVAPTITTQPQPLAGVVGAPGSISVTATNATGFQWFKGGVAIPGATSSTLAFASLNPSDAGIYDVQISNPIGDTLSAPVVVGVVPANGGRSAGATTTRAEWLNIHHPNGATYDQFLLNGAAGTFTADPGEIARCSYLDENGSIVQVEMSGAGAITIVLDPATASGPKAPALYNQPGVEYMQGKATIILSGANETTHFTIYSVGTATNPGVTKPDVTYAGWANVAAAGIVSTDGKLGGIHQGNANYNANVGLTGIYAPTVTSVGGLVVVHSIEARADAQPYLFFGPAGTANVKIAGSSLAQPNGDSITVSGLAKVTMGAGQDSCGRAAPAQPIGTRLIDTAGNDVTAAVVAP